MPDARPKTLSEHLTQFVLPANNDTGRTISTVETYACYARAFCRFVGKAAECDAFTAQALRHFRNQYITQNRPCQNTIRIVVYGLRAFGAFLVAEGAIQEPNPALNLIIPDQMEGDRLVVPDADAYAYLAACERIADDKRAIFSRAMLSVLIHAGLRYSEILNLRMKDVNLETCEIVVIRGKGNKKREVEICQAAADALRDFVRIRPPNAQADWFWMRNNQVRYGRGSINSMLSEVIAIAGHKGDKNKKYTPHCFRHGYVTGLLQQPGADVKTVSDLVGHSSAATTLNIYCHTDKTRRRMVADMSAQRFAAFAQAAADAMPPPPVQAIADEQSPPLQVPEVVMFSPTPAARPAPGPDLAAAALGWICPRCLDTLAPSVQRCGCAAR